MYIRRFAPIAVGFLAATTIAACGPDTKEGEPVDVTHQSASQAISDNSLSIAASLAASLQMLENSDIFAAGVDATVGATSDGDVACADFNDSNCVEPEPAPETMELDTTINDGSQALVDILETHVFVDANIETEAQTEVTYLLRGDVLCPAFEGQTTVSSSGSGSIDGSADGSTVEGDVVVEENSGCVEAIDAAEIRLRVTSTLPGDIDVAILVGPQRHNPASFEFHQTRLAAELDLAGAKASIEQIASAIGEDAPELPSVMAGRVRAELTANGANSVTSTFSVLTPVDIQHPQFSMQAAAASPASSLTIDGAAQQIRAESNMGNLDIGFVVETFMETVDEMGNFTESVESTRYDLHLPGATSDITFDVASETLTMNGMGLGNGTTSLKIDGAEVLTIDLNANNGRTFDATVTAAATDDVQLAVSPVFDLAIGMKFENDPSFEGDSWMLNDTMSILLAGDPNPALLLGSNGVEVLRGELSMGLANEGSLIEVTAGQCLRDVGSEPTPGTGAEPVEPVESGPFDNLEAGTCG